MKALAATLLLNAAMLGQPTGPISGVVLDAVGGRVPNANVTLEVEGRQVRETRTALDGRFEFKTDVTGNIGLVVTAPGFARAFVMLADGAPRTVRIVLQPTPFFEEVQVTSSGGGVAQADANATVSVFSAPALRTRSTLTIDDALKMVPGFTLNRRASSRVSNPGSQSMTLRGLGGAGASRSLVLADGVPLNDGFAGWVYWDKIPQASIDRIDVLRGGGSDLYGADAVGGVVQILTLRPSHVSVRALVEGGGLGTGRASLFGGGQKRGWSFTGAGEWFTTDGYIMVAEDERGLIDTPAGSKHRSAFSGVSYYAASGWRFDARGNVFSEDRKNGTPAQVNDTNALQVSGEVAGAVGGGLLSARTFVIRQRHHQTFSVISAEPPRASEDLNRLDYVSTRSVGVSAQWVRLLGRHSLLTGGEGRFIKGGTEETRLTGGQVLGTSNVDGTQSVGSAFARATFVLSDRLTVMAGARSDSWHSESSDTSLAETVGSFSPRVSFLYRFGTTGVAVRGSAYRGFRAPTLNELYRGFRVGNNVTNPNEALKPEKLTAGEGGLLFNHGRMSARATGFWNVLDDTITQVTISTSPSLNVRQRQNADKLRSIGVEFEGNLRLPHSVFVVVTSAIINSRFKGDTPLRNYRVPQVASYNVGLNVRYDDSVWIVSGLLRVTGPQFEDDVNTLMLHRATVFDMQASRRIARRLNAFIAIENVFDSDYDVGRTPTRTVGLTRAVRGGVQVALP